MSASSTGSALKAGVMEIPDVIVVNKCHHPMTDVMIREIEGVLSLSAARDWRVPIVKTEAVLGEGLDELASRLDEHRAHISSRGDLDVRRRRNLANEVIGMTLARLRRHLESLVADSAEVHGLVDEVAERRRDPAAVADLLYERIVGGRRDA